MGPFSDCSAPVLCKDPVYPPGPTGIPKVVDSTRKSVTLSWMPPSFEGGSDVTGYHVEVCTGDAEIESWSRCTPSVGIKTTEYTISDLQENKLYKFRVYGYNIAGLGEPTLVPVAIQPAERFESPEISPDGDLRKNLTVKAGNSIRFVSIQ